MPEIRNANNLDMRVEGGKLIITIDVSDDTIANAQYSNTGKSKLIASSRGWRAVNGVDGLSISLNLSYR